MDLHEAKLFEATALHESGHIVAGHFLGAEIGNAFICLPGHLLDGAKGAAYISNVTNPVHAAAVDFAGCIAECFCLNVEYRFIDPEINADMLTRYMKQKTVLNEKTGAVKADWNAPASLTAPALESYANGCNWGDVANVWTRLNKSGLTHGEAVEVFKRAQHLAMRIIADNLPKVRALACVLEAEHTISSAQIKALLA